MKKLFEIKTSTFKSYFAIAESYDDAVRLVKQETSKDKDVNIKCVEMIASPTKGEAENKLLMQHKNNAYDSTTKEI